ncbi:MAG: hypothetical protein JXX28_00340 [Deltaproteobacteria bacterium]|nr:hypothetical protein [Deltaproteobacteria bacterium]
MTQPLTAWHSFSLRKAAPDEPSIGAYGGHPRGIRPSEWPRCAVCGAPMCHMGQLDAGEWLDLGGYARMSLFICHATGGRCEDWDPWKGANRVILHKEIDNSLYDGPPTVRVYRRVLLAVDPPLDELALMMRVKKDGLPMRDALRSLRHDKLGGGAVWLHGDSTPKSVAGQGPMTLALQLTTSLVRFDITPKGMAYVFLDPHDRSPEAGRMLWQGS